MKRLLFILALLACCETFAAGDKPNFYKADSEMIRFIGRSARNDDGSLAFDWSGSHFTFRFEGTRCVMRVADTKRNYYNIFVDGKLYGKATVTGNTSDVLLAEGLRKGMHTILVQKRTEGGEGRTTLYGIETNGKLLALPPASTRLIEFIGDSHTCGYGTEGKSFKEPYTPETENCDLAWGCIIARYFGAEYVLIAHSGQGIVRNWADKKETSDLTMRERMLRTFDMEETPQWDFQQYKPDIVVIKLGTNDFSTGTSPSEEAFSKSFETMYGQLREKYGADTPILYVAPQHVETIYRYMQGIIQKLGDKNLHCILHFKEVTNSDSDLGANYHPNHSGQRKIAAAVIPYIATITGWDMPMEPIQ